MTTLPPPPGYKPSPNSKGVLRRLTSDEIKTVADFAAKTSQMSTCRHFNLSYTAVARAMRLHGVKPRRPGNYTNAELENVLTPSGALVVTP
jgi:hypothetical protein